MLHVPCSMFLSRFGMFWFQDFHVLVELWFFLLNFVELFILLLCPLGFVCYFACWMFACFCFFFFVISFFNKARLTFVPISLPTVRTAFGSSFPFFSFPLNPNVTEEIYSQRVKMNLWVFESITWTRTTQKQLGQLGDFVCTFWQRDAVRMIYRQLKWKWHTDSVHICTQILSTSLVSRAVKPFFFFCSLSHPMCKIIPD